MNAISTRTLTSRALKCAAVAAMVLSPSRLRSLAEAQPGPDRGVVVRSEEFTRRRALVIGNAHYADEESLENAINDARDVHRALRTAGYEATLVLDASREQLRGAVEGFTRDLRRGDLALVYYAGHGASLSGTSYLIPVDFRGTSERSLDAEGYSASNLVHNLAATEATSVVVFDACRSPPHVAPTRRIRTRSTGRRHRRGVEGFGGVSAPPQSDMVVINATSPDADAADVSRRCPRHSPFTCAFLPRIPEMRTLGELQVDIIRDVREDTDRTQQPWFSFASARAIVLAPGAPAASDPPRPTAAPASPVFPAASQPAAPTFGATTAPQLDRFAIGAVTRPAFAPVQAPVFQPDFGGLLLDADRVPPGAQPAEFGGQLLNVPFDDIHFRGLAFTPVNARASATFSVRRSADFRIQFDLKINHGCSPGSGQLSAILGFEHDPRIDVTMVFDRADCMGDGGFTTTIREGARQATSTRSPNINGGDQTIVVVRRGTDILLEVRNQWVATVPGVHRDALTSIEVRLDRIQRGYGPHLSRVEVQ